MKARNGYVSNSSSSSFVVVPDGVVEEYNGRREEKDLYAFERLKTLFDFSNASEWHGLFLDGEVGFGWQLVNYHHMKDKWNWLALQACYARECGDFKYSEMLDRYVDSLQLGLRIDWDTILKEMGDAVAYIDHQSIEPKDTFDEVAKVGLDEFLVNEKCIVHNGNDNCSEDEEDEREERF